jgi:quinol monooxygenase YgiN
MTARLLFGAALALALAAPAAQAQDEPPVITLVKSKVKDPAKPFALRVEFKVKAGMEKEFEAAFAPCLKATRKEPGSAAYFLHRSPDHPDLYFMYEQFKSVDALAEHMKQEHTKKLLETIGPMIEGEPKITVAPVVG